MSNDALREAIKAAGLTQSQMAESLGVDPKTVQRWITPGVTPHQRHRLALAALLGAGEDHLWPTGSRRRSSAETLAIVELEKERHELRNQVASLEVERRHYEQALWRLAQHSTQRVRVRSRVVEYSIGRKAKDDVTVDTWEVESLDVNRGLIWWLITFLASGEQVPPKSSSRQLEVVEAHSIQEDGQTRPLRVLNLDHRDGKIWAIVIFDRPLVHQTWRLRWSWEGAWNMLRRTRHDFSTLNLAEAMRQVEYEDVSVAFRFPDTARTPEARIGTGMPQLPRTVTEDENGVVFRFHIESPERQIYEWDLEAQGFAPDPVAGEGGSSSA